MGKGQLITFAAGLTAFHLTFGERKFVTIFGVGKMVEQYFDFDTRYATSSGSAFAFENAGNADPNLGGFRASAQIATARGLVRVDGLKSTDLVLTRDAGYVPVIAINRVPLTQQHAKPMDVLISANAISFLIPPRDMFVAPSQLILLQEHPTRIASETFIRAGDLANHVRGVRLVEAQQPRFNIICEKHEVILVDEIWVGTGYSQASYGAALLEGRRFANTVQQTSEKLSRPLADLTTFDASVVSAAWAKHA